MKAVPLASRTSTQRRVVRLADLSSAQRRLVLALVAAAKSEAAPVIENPERLVSEGTRNADPTL